MRVLMLERLMILFWLFFKVRLLLEVRVLFLLFVGVERMVVGVDGFFMLLEKLVFVLL